MPLSLLVSLALVPLARASFANSSAQARAHKAGPNVPCLHQDYVCFACPLQPVCPRLTKKSFCTTASHQHSFEMKQASPEQLGPTLWPLNVPRSQIVATTDGFDTQLKWPDPNLTHLAARPLELLPCVCFLCTGHGCLRSRLGPDGKTQGTAHVCPTKLGCKTTKHQKALDMVGKRQLFSCQKSTEYVPLQVPAALAVALEVQWQPRKAREAKKTRKARQASQA